MKMKERRRRRGGTSEWLAALALFSGVIMAPLHLDKYVDIARHCKYLPENDLKVS